MTPVEVVEHTPPLPFPEELPVQIGSVREDEISVEVQSSPSPDYEHLLSAPGLIGSSKIGGLLQKEINEMAKDNFEKEMKKHRSSFKKIGNYCLIYTEGSLKNTKT